MVLILRKKLTKNLAKENDFRSDVEDAVYEEAKKIAKDDTDEEKHLLLHAYSIKEAFFSRAAIIFEGISECATMPFFAPTQVGFGQGSGRTRGRPVASTAT